MAPTTPTTTNAGASTAHLDRDRRGRPAPPPAAHPAHFIPTGERTRHSGQIGVRHSTQVSRVDVPSLGHLSSSTGAATLATVPYGP